MEKGPLHQVVLASRYCGDMLESLEPLRGYLPNFGSEVSIWERGDKFLAFEDKKISLCLFLIAQSTEFSDLTNLKALRLRSGDGIGVT